MLSKSSDIMLLKRRPRVDQTRLFEAKDKKIGLFEVEQIHTRVSRVEQQKIRLFKAEQMKSRLSKV